MDVLPPEMHMEIIARCDRLTLGRLGQANRTWHGHVQPALISALLKGIAYHTVARATHDMQWTGISTIGTFTNAGTRILPRAAAGVGFVYERSLECEAMFSMSGETPMVTMASNYSFIKSLAQAEAFISKCPSITHKTSDFPSKVQRHLAAHPNGALIVPNDFLRPPNIGSGLWIRRPLLVFFANDVDALLDEIRRVVVIAQRLNVTFQKYPVEFILA